MIGSRLGAGSAGHGAALLDRCAAAGLPVPAGAVGSAGGASPDEDALAALIVPRPSRLFLRLVAEPDAGSTVPFAAAPAEVAALLASGAVLLLGAVDAVHAGTVLCGGHEDVVTGWEVTAEAVAAGADGERRSWIVPRARRRRRPHRATDGIPLPPWGIRLAGLVRAVAGVMADDADGLLRLDWRDDGHRCWLFGVCPLTQSGESRAVAG